MPKAEWGVKRTCPNCETRFYDLQREPILCPECGATFNIDDHGKVSGMRERRVPVAVAEDEEALVDDEEALADDDEEEGVEDPLLADEDEDDEPASPALADEEDEEAQTVPFKDAGLIEDDDDIDEEVEEDEEDEDDLEDLDDGPGKDQGI